MIVSLFFVWIPMFFGRAVGGLTHTYYFAEEFYPKPTRLQILPGVHFLEFD